MCFKQVPTLDFYPIARGFRSVVEYRYSEFQLSIKVNVVDDDVRLIGNFESRFADQVQAADCPIEPNAGRLRMAQLQELTDI
jgi:hypothetical protein